MSQDPRAPSGPGRAEPFEARVRLPGLFSFWLLLSMTLVLGGLYRGIEFADPLVFEVFEALVMAFPPLLWVYLALRRSGRKVSELVGTLPASRDWLRWTVTGLALAAFGLGTNWTSAVLRSAFAPELLAQLPEELAQRTSAWPSGVVLWTLVDAALLAPFVLELVFRGVALRRFVHLRGARGGVLAVVLLYAVVHGLWRVDPLGSAAMGLVTALLYLETRSLVVPMFVHGVANTALVGLGYLLEGAAEAESAGLVEVLTDLRWPATLACLVAAPLLVREVRRSSACLPALQAEAERESALP